MLTIGWPGGVVVQDRGQVGLGEPAVHGGMSERPVDLVLGHCQASVTLNVYAHVTPSGQADAMRRLGAALAAR